MSEIQIGLSKNARPTYSLDDVALVPTRRTRDRRDVDTSWQIDAFKFDTPIIGAPMDSVMSPATAIALGKLGGLGVLNLEGLWTRYEDPTPILERISHLGEEESIASLQRIYSEPIKPSLITARLKQLREAGVVVAGKLSPQRVQKYWRAVVDAGVDLFIIRGSTVSAEAVLVAVGRVPNTDGIGLDEAGVELTDRGFVAVDEHLRASAANVWAAGDCAGTPMFTHASWSDFRIIRAQLTGASLDDPTTTTKGRTIPYAVFATPELARIGLSEGEAREAGLDVRIAKIPTAAIPRAKTMRYAGEGFWKAVVDANTHQILGATLIGPNVSEVITAVQVAMAGGLTYEQLRFLPVAHPTMAEGLQVLFDSLG